MKISSYLLGLGAISGLVALNVAPAHAQVGNGSNNGNIFTSVTSTGGGGVAGGGEPSYAPQTQSAVNQFSQSLTANAVGDAATFDVINGAAPAQLVTGLVPAGVPADGATSKAAMKLAATVQGMRTGNGNINATKLNESVGAYNEYVKALVGEVGPEKAVNEGPAGQKALQALLGQLVQVANQSAPTPEAPSAAPGNPTAPTPTAPPVPTTPSVPSTPSAPPAPSMPK
jgi:hypothetical protein